MAAAAEEKGDDGSSLSSMKAALLAPISKLKVSDLDLTTQPIVLSSKLSPRQALKELMKHHIRCAPVIDNGKFVGVFDLRDSIKHAVEVYRQHHLTEKDTQAMEYIAVSPHISTNTLVYLARMRRFYAVKTTDPLINILKVVCDGPHIVGVLSDDGKKLVSILSQGEIFKQISAHWTKDKIKCDVNLKLLLSKKVGASPVISIEKSVKAHVAFETMAQKQLSGLAVVDKTGKLVHNTSATDIKLWLIASQSLDDTIEEFLIAVRKHHKSKKLLFPVSSSKEDESFLKVIAKLRVTGYHRQWVVDTAHKPTGVIALTDIMAFVSK